MSPHTDEVSTGEAVDHANVEKRQLIAISGASAAMGLVLAFGLVSLQVGGERWELRVARLLEQAPVPETPTALTVMGTTLFLAVSLSRLPDIETATRHYLRDVVLALLIGISMANWTLTWLVLFDQRLLGALVSLVCAATATALIAVRVRDEEVSQLEAQLREKQVQAYKRLTTSQSNDNANWLAGYLMDVGWVVSITVVVADLSPRVAFFTITAALFLFAGLRGLAVHWKALSITSAVFTWLKGVGVALLVPAFLVAAMLQANLEGNRWWAPILAVVPGAALTIAGIRLGCYRDSQVRFATKRASLLERAGGRSNAPGAVT